MNKGIEKSSGLALLAGSVLMLSTMVLHPEGGNLTHLIKVAPVIVISHSAALLAIPFLGVGFWGLNKRLGDNYFLPLLAFAFMITALIAGMIAATINGLALPVFIQNYKDANIEITTAIKPLMRNNIALNQAFDYVFLSAVSLSIFFWSISILILKKLTLWIGYFGLLLSLITIVMLLSGFVFVSLHGFRLFILLNVVWISLVGIALIRSKQIDNSNSFPR